MMNEIALVQDPADVAGGGTFNSSSNSSNTIGSSSPKANRASPLRIEKQRQQQQVVEPAAATATTAAVSSAPSLFSLPTPSLLEGRGAAMLPPSQTTTAAATTTQSGGFVEVTATIQVTARQRQISTMGKNASEEEVNQQQQEFPEQEGYKRCSHNHDNSSYKRVTSCATTATTDRDEKHCDGPYRRRVSFSSNLPQQQSSMDTRIVVDGDDEDDRNNNNSSSNKNNRTKNNTKCHDEVARHAAAASTATLTTEATTATTIQKQQCAVPGSRKVVDTEHDGVSNQTSDADDTPRLDLAPSLKQSSSTMISSCLLTDNDTATVSEDTDTIVCHSLRMGARRGLAMYFIVLLLVILLNSVFVFRQHAEDQPYQQQQECGPNQQEDAPLVVSTSTGITVHQYACLVPFLILGIANYTKILSLVFREDDPSIRALMVLSRSGFLFGTFSIQLIALVTNLFLWILAPTTTTSSSPTAAILYHAVRCAEWISSVYLMTYLATNIHPGDDDILESTKTKNAPEELRIRAGTRQCYSIFACAAGSSTVMIFSLCKNVQEWTLVLSLSLILFVLPIYKWVFRPRAIAYSGLTKIREQQGDSTGTPLLSYEENFEIQECHEGLIRTSYILARTCTITCFALLVVCAIASLVPLAVSDPQGFSSVIRSFQTIFVSILGVGSKIVYLNILVDAYCRYFDLKARQARHLEKSRILMKQTCDTSSKALLLCRTMEDCQKIKAMLSPALLKILGVAHPEESAPFARKQHDEMKSLVLKIDSSSQEFSVYSLNLSKSVQRSDVELIRRTMKESRTSLCKTGALSDVERNIAIIARLALNACRAESKVGDKFPIELTRMDPEVKGTSFSCEATLSETSNGSGAVIVLKDVSECTQRVHKESGRKSCDGCVSKSLEDQTIKFSRHEIKNGILAAIALLDHIKETSTCIPEQENENENVNEKIHGSASTQKPALTRRDSSESESPDCCKTNEALCELESTLRDVLDTILDEGLTRDIVCGVYRPRKERVKVFEVLSSLNRRAPARFPIRCNPAPFPELALDRHLLRYIYRNAVSNACKYGKHDGCVETILSYKSGFFKMEVINAPGAGHDELLKLDAEAVDAVFDPGTQLDATKARAGHRLRHESSGNGAWIMQKCAEALGGRCQIRFEQARTVFSLSCQVQVFPSATRGRSTTTVEIDDFALPENTWGIVVDDSAIQRKVMDRFLKMAGIRDSQRVILGKDATEVFGMCETVADLMRKNPDDKFLLIVDENLDIEGGARHVSGSLSVEKLRKQLDDKTESRLLALIRSANDSISDIELYKSRAHGFLLKEPVKKGAILEKLQPWWDRRFYKNERRVLSFHQQNFEDIFLYQLPAEDIQESLDVITALLCVQSESVMGKRWRIIREKLVALKGDLKTMGSKESLLSVVDRIDRLMCSRELPDRFVDQWDNLKSQIESEL